jgi:glycolate oxidase FAD binding subunit
VTSIAAVRKLLAGAVSDPIPGAPDADLTVAPAGSDELATVLRAASEHRLPVLVWGGGTHQGYGGRIAPAIVVSTARLDRIDWRPDDLTVTVGAGVRLGDLGERLAERNQTAVLPEDTGDATVGGVLAAGLSGWRRLRYGPTRDRVLGVTLVTGDGRTVHAGGVTVKNVAGYDLSRLAVGSLGRLGVIVEATLKLWPSPRASATVTGVDPDAALETTYRPFGIVETEQETRVVLGGTPDGVDAEAELLGGVVETGARWPAPLVEPVQLTIRVPPRHLRAAVAQLPDGCRYRAAIGVGELRYATEAFELDHTIELRRWAESVGGSLIAAAAPKDVYDRFDPWGSPPASLPIQRRLVERFDPARILNPGRLPGGL